ncbi:sigma 54-interacting transcriptional regulator [Ruminococcaceae bacterium OttesenSCG-928-O06]|nr:sigma 54-interacting transcriptional regulator [Ruminococcaceae bacterium OttesenSCG-928-O06]
MGKLTNDLILEAVAEMCMDGIVVIDEDEKIVYVNDYFCENTNMTREDALGKVITDVSKTTNLPRTLKTGETVFGYWHDITTEAFYRPEGVEFLHINRMPIIANGAVVGAIAYQKRFDTAQNVAETFRKMNEDIAYYQRELLTSASVPKTFQHIVTVDPELTRLKAIAAKAAGSMIPILLTGETGTGKEVFANAIHNASPRRSHPFIKVNCGSLPEALIESELFGYEKGAFTGANKEGKPGKFEQASGGTIFLDEIGELPYAMQVKLLRVLQGGEFERVGGSATIKGDFRVIAATNKNLEREVAEGRFREDLYYRIGALPIEIPPLRQRRSDIPHLVETFLTDMNRRYGTNTTIGEDAIQILMRQPLHGNVRELKNIVERSHILCESDCIDGTNLLLTKSIAPQSVPLQGEALTAKQQAEREQMQRALEKTAYNCVKAAESLGMVRSTFYRKVEKYGISLNRGK